MNALTRLVNDTPIPSLACIAQPFSGNALGDVAGAVGQSLEGSGIGERIFPGMRVAVGVGSRGIAELPLLVRTCVAWLREKGAHPFIVPAMGSHGGATAEGQKMVLRELGVTEASAGCPIQCTMDVVSLGVLENGLPVYMDSFAHAADGIFVINRVKPHTSFRAENESGIVKMLCIGLGKQKGADRCHSYGVKPLGKNIRDMAAVILEKAAVLGGLATVENARDEICRVEAVPATRFMEQDAALLDFARDNMPSLPFDALDVLIIDEMGKNIAGTGVDPNVIGRFTTRYTSGGPDITRITVLDLTEESGGNANGMGLVDIVTKRLRDKIDFAAVYTNCLTSAVIIGSMMPMVMDSDKSAIQAAIKTCHAANMAGVRVARIRNTLQTGQLWVSPSLLGEARAKGCEIITGLAPLLFTEQGDLTGQTMT